jgi:hypothetical protein
MPIIGRDFLRGFAYRIDSPHGKIYLVRKSDASPEDIASHGPNMYAIKSGGGGGNVEGPGTAAQQQWTEIPINKVGNLFIVSVYVDGSQVAMQLGSESGCVFSANQISGINSDYVNGGNQQQSLNGQMVTTTSSINLKLVRLGPITVTNFPAQIVDYSNARFQAFQWVTSEYPVLGSYIWDGWEHIIDEKKMVIRVRKIPTQ